MVLYFLAITIRYGSLEFPPSSTDPGRDFYVARHIIEYGEFPQFGPANSASSVVKNSPLYFYFAAFLSLFSGSSYFKFTILNTLVMSFLVIPFFMVGRALGGLWIGILSVAIFIFVPPFVELSRYVFMPSAMLLAIVPAYYFLYKWQKTESISNLIVAIACFALGAALHISGFFLFLGVLLFLVLNFNGNKKRHTILSVGIYVLIVALFYWTSLVSLLGNSTYSFIHEAFRMETSLFTILENTYYGLLSNARSQELVWSLLAVVFVISVGGLFFVSKIWKWLVGLVVSITALPFFISSSDFTWYHHYSLSVLMVFCILFLSIVASLPRGFKNGVVILCCGLLVATYFNPSTRRINDSNYQEAIGALHSAITHNSERYSNNFVIHMSHDNMPGYEGEVLYSLEKKLGKKLGVVDANSGTSISQTNSSEHIFLVCKWSYAQARDCTKNFPIPPSASAFIEYIYSSEEYDILTFANPNEEDFEDN